ncbi:MAG: hypothetical protein KGH63_02610 [Candidatus Micrarchaeota archaeon]|nr:hypothetical protein [Candidatus Micrarchaeota archaeon]
MATLGLTAVSFAASFSGGISNIAGAASNLCGQLISLLPVISMLMVIAAGVVYAAGQIMGAETRARANTWATAMLVGAIIGIVIVAVAPPILQALYGSSGSTWNCSVQN